MNFFLERLRNYAEAKDKKLPVDSSSATCEWLEIQKLAMLDTPEDDETIKEHVLEAQRLSINLPVVRKVANTEGIAGKAGVTDYKIGQTVICDIVSTECRSQWNATSTNTLQHAASQVKPKDIEEKSYLAYGSTLSEDCTHYHARSVSVICLTEMVKVMAQMKNLRRSHHTQGRLKKVNIDQTYEGYANFMAPKRMEEIRQKCENLDKSKLDQRIFDSRILKPKIDTYLTPEWDEMIPFPTSKSSLLLKL